MSELTPALRKQIGAAVGDWGDELLVTMKERLAQDPETGSVGPDSIHRLTGAIMLELGTAVGALLLATVEEIPDWILTPIWASAAMKVIVPKIRERESVLIEKAIQNNVDVGRYTDNLASNPQAIATAKKWGMTTPKEIREVVGKLAQDLAQRDRRFITAAAPIVLDMAFEGASVSRLEGLLGGHTDKGRGSSAPASAPAQAESPVKRSWWQIWS
jgi:hypothetical protein